MMRGIRGAATIELDSSDAILEETCELLVEMTQRNGVEPDDIASVLFTLSPDLHAAFPAKAARELGWKYVPVICARELDVDHGLSRTIRVMMHVETTRHPREIQHVYLGRAVALREDLISEA